MTNKKLLSILFLVFASLGFLDAAYLAAKYYNGTPVECSLLNGCEAVTTSPYAAIGGVSIALLGAIYYFVLLLLGFMYLDSPKRSTLLTLVAITAAGFLASLRFVYLQVFVIKALCGYCLLSALSTTVLFSISIYLWHTRDREEQPGAKV
ncbi:MAG: vitamin K epoxide reductase family protein [Candidatus Sungbacteria bacterium]|uniref:Vitamin K epoxide reductase family protein n=1 Tax=Candidatus Sungiibacteriota bacterium TaxID=2750080 RepID=A0A931WP68_9BACT|nr:vitamin K epoxide reductase family protein [Candidatus Sungbacteria bacterium]